MIFGFSSPPSIINTMPLRLCWSFGGLGVFPRIGISQFLLLRISILLSYGPDLDGIHKTYHWLYTDTRVLASIGLTSKITPLFFSSLNIPVWFGIRVGVLVLDMSGVAWLFLFWPPILLGLGDCQSTTSFIRWSMVSSASISL